MANITVYSGPMKSGKTQEILNEYKRQLISGKNVKMFKPKIDTRDGKNVVASRNGIDIPAIIISSIDEIANYNAQVYCIDEFQFLNGDVKIIQNMADEGKKFFISGLNLTAEKKPFGKMADLFCIADDIHILSAICDNCKCENAVYTYYTGTKNSDIQVGNAGYLALCRDCYNLMTKNKENKNEKQRLNA